MLLSSVHSIQVWGPVKVVSSQHHSQAGDYPLLAVRDCVWGRVNNVSSQHKSKAGDFPLLAVRDYISDTQAHSYSRLSPPSTT